MYIYIYTHKYSTHPHPDTFIPCLFSSHLFLYSCMMIWFEIRNCLPSIKRDKIFTCQLQQAKDISEKASLGNLCRSSQNLTYKAWCFCSTFLQKKNKSMAKRGKQPKLQLLPVEDIFTQRQQRFILDQMHAAYFLFLRKKHKFLVLPASLLSPALHSSLPLQSHFA